MDDAVVPNHELRHQLERMLQAEEFIKRPWAVKLLRFFAEESIRNGHAPVNQRLIASHAIGLPDDFSPTRSALVRVNILRLRKSLDRYYAGIGSRDPVRLTITRGPYRLVATRVAGAARVTETARVARAVRRRLPTLIVMAPEVRGVDDGRIDETGFGRTVVVFLVSQLVESTLVTVTGPMRRDPLPDNDMAVAARAAMLGYDYVAESAIRVGGERWTMRLAVTDTEMGTRIFDARGSIPAPDERELAAAADAVADWFFHKISNGFAVRGRGATQDADA